MSQATVTRCNLVADYAISLPVRLAVWSVGKRGMVEAYLSEMTVS